MELEEILRVLIDNFPERLSGTVVVLWVVNRLFFSKIIAVVRRAEELIDKVIDLRASQAASLVSLSETSRAKMQLYVNIHSVLCEIRDALKRRPNTL